MSLKKSLRNLLDKTSKVKGQATLEYLVLFSVIVLATAFAVTKTSVLDRLQSSGAKVVNQATIQINEVTSGALPTRSRAEYEECRQKCYVEFIGQADDSRLQICYGECELLLP